jgi:hypothetical protein
MTQPLVAEALSQSWGNPNPNNQEILRPARLTPINGVQRRFRYAWTQYGLPNGTSRFHVYQTGQINPNLVNLFEAKDGWQLLSQACNNTKVMAHLHTQLGVVLPLTRCWYRWVDKKNIFLAVEINTNIAVPWPQLEVFLRLYRNTFFESSEAGVDDELVIDGGIMTNTAAITTLQSTIHDIQNAVGYNNGLIIFVNGVRAPGVSVITTKVGDVAEYVYDTSIYKVVDFTINDLPTFFSTLDNKAKRLLHYNDPTSTLLDYEDHIDFYIVHVQTGAGCYVHKNAADTVRQLTHKDYAITADYLPPYYVNFHNSQGVVDTSKLRLRMFVRYSGQGQVHKLDANMSTFLMELNDLNQAQAMVGSQATLPLWQAATLEKSAFMRLLRSRYNDITPLLVEQAYGYYRVNTILGPSIFELDDSGQMELPPAFQHSSTAFEYDEDGVLLGAYPMADLLIYFRANAGCKVVEFVEGLGGKSIEEFYGSNPISLQDGVNYRFYLKVSDAQTNQPAWQDVTGTAHYTVDNGVAYWGPNTITNSLDRLVRSDKKFLSYEALLPLDGGLLTHQINYDKITYRGVINSPLQVPLGELDVWLNDKPLVRGVDYLLSFPTISIVNKTLLDETGAAPHLQKLRVRMTGFCDPQLQVNPLDEVGFVFNGVLSANGRHDMHREKIQRIVVNGGLKTLSQVAFLEDGEDAMELSSPLEGKPYEIRDVINRLPGMIQSEPYALYRTTRTNTLQAEDYVTQRRPQEVAFPVSPITERYTLFSPFLSKILADLVAEYIDLSEFDVPYSDALVRSLCVPYLYLLPLDPIGPGNLPDARYCEIQPHPFSSAIELSLLQYAFFERVVKIFAGEKVVYGPLVQLAP